MPVAPRFTMINFEYLKKRRRTIFRLRAKPRTTVRDLCGDVFSIISPKR
jgi:hypothetical protein